MRLSRRHKTDSTNLGAPVSAIGEFGLIDAIARRVRAAQPPAQSDDLLLGIGDDAAAWRLGDRVQLATTDTLVAPWDFLPNRARWEDVGWKAMAANISDIAAMGGTPTWALITTGLPTDFELRWALELCHGMLACATRYGVRLVGGDVARSEQPFITIALLGEAGLDSNGAAAILRRDGARVGERLAVTGALGASTAGLQLVLEQRQPASAAERAILEAHYRPEPRVAFGRALVVAGVRAGMDISDGLVADAAKLAKSSGCGAVIQSEKVPVSTAARRVFPNDARAFALVGGEDFELLVAGSPEALRAAAAAGVSLTVVGEMTADEPGDVRVLDAAGYDMPLTTTGWEQFQERTS